MTDIDIERIIPLETPQEHIKRFSIGYQIPRDCMRIMLIDVVAIVIQTNDELADVFNATSIVDEMMGE